MIVVEVEFVSWHNNSNNNAFLLRLVSHRMARLKRSTLSCTQTQETLWIHLRRCVFYADKTLYKLRLLNESVYLIDKIGIFLLRNVMRFKLQGLSLIVSFYEERLKG